MGKKRQTRRDFLSRVAAAGIAGVAGTGLGTRSIEKAFAADSSLLRPRISLIRRGTIRHGWARPDRLTFSERSRQRP